MHQSAELVAEGGKELDRSDWKVFPSVAQVTLDGNVNGVSKAVVICIAVEVQATQH